MKKNMSELSLESRILIITALVGMIFSFSAAIGNYLLGAGIIPTTAAFSMGLLTIYFFYLAYFKKSYIVPAYSALLTLTLIIIPLLWVYNGGLSGSIPFFYIFNICLSAILLNKLRYKIILSIQILVLISLLIFEFNYPDYIISFSSKTADFIDKSVSIVVISLAMFLMIIKIMKEYYLTIDKLRSTYKELQKSNDVLYNAAITDELTGLINRRHIIELLADQIENDRHQKGMSTIMVDIDHFKKINDTYGHSIGDQVLIKVSKLLKDNLRCADFVGRIGGEEFLILMPDTSRETAFNRADDLRKSVADLKWDYTNLRVTISAGIYHCNCDGSENCDTILNNSDIALYQAKNEGRNLIRAFNAVI